MSEGNPILIVEPIVPVRVPMSLVFRKLGFVVEEATSIVDCLHVLGDHVPQCILVAEELGEGERGSDLLVALSRFKKLSNMHAILVHLGCDELDVEQLPAHVVIIDRSEFASLPELLQAVLASYKLALTLNPEVGESSAPLEKDVTAGKEAEVDSLSVALAEFSKVIGLIARNKLPGPIMPAVLTQVEDLIRQDADFRIVGGFVSKHQGIASRLLALANSAFYLRGVRAKTTEQAISRLGMKETYKILRALAMLSYVVGDDRQLKALIMRNLTRSYLVATFVETLAKIARIDKPELQSLALLHNVGATFFVYTLALLQKRGDIKSVDSSAVEIILKTKAGRLNRVICEKLKLPSELANIYSFDASTIAEGTANRSLTLIHQGIWVASRVQDVPGEERENYQLELDDEGRFLGVTEVTVVQLNSQMARLLALFSDYQSIVGA